MPNSQNGNVGQQLSVLGYGSADAPVCLNESYAAPCITTPIQCIGEFQIEELAGNEFQISLIPDTTLTGNLARTTEMLVTIRTLTGGFMVGNLTSLIPGVTFNMNGSYRGPADSPDYDYFNFQLATIGTDLITYTTGQKVPLFKFTNSGICSGGPVEIMDPENDPYMMPNSDNSTVGLNLKIAAFGADPVVTCFINDPTNDCPDVMTDIDTTYVTMRTDMPNNTCLGNLVELFNGIGNVSICGQGDFVTVGTTNGSDCVTLTPNGDFHEQDTVCVIHCDSNIPDYCDTTIIIICPQVVASPADPICPGESVDLETIGGAGTFTWTPATGLSCTDCPNPIASPTVTTTYTITADDGLGCSTSDQVTVTVNAQPVASFDYDGSCAAAPTVFTNTSSNSGVGASFDWDFGDGNSSTAENPSHQYAGNGTFTVTLMVTTADGCKDVTTADVTITAASVGGTSFSFDACESQIITLSASNGTNYTWSPSTGLNATDVANPDLTVTTNATYLVEVTDANGCGQIDTVFVNVLPIVGGASFEFEGCDGQTISLSASAGAAYSWSPATGLSATDVANPDLTVTGNASYLVEVSDANGCKQIDTVNVSVLPIVGGTSFDFEGCDGQTISLSASAGAAYSWSPATGLNATDVANPELTVTGNASYLVEVSDANGCKQIDTVNVSVLPVIGGTSYTFEGCEGETIQLSATAGTSYEWSPSTGLSATDVANPNLTVSTPATYLVRVTGAMGCGQIDTVFVNVNTTTDGTSYTFEACRGETIELSASNGMTFNWTPATGLSATDIANPSVTVADPTVYYVNVVGATGCGQTDTVYLNVTNPPVIIDVLSEDPTSCDDPDGSIKVFATDGGNPLEYSIDCGMTWQTSNYFPDLGKDTFCVVVRSTVTGCTATWPDVIILNAPSVPIINNVNPVAPSACGQNDGTITVSATSNSGQLEYSIDGVLWQDSPEFNGLEAGNYFVWVRVKGGQACEVEFIGNPIQINDPNPPAILTPLDSVYTCDGVAKTVTIEISEDIASYNISGGGAYTAASFNGAILTFNVIPVTTNSNYIVEIEGVNGCSVIEDFKLFSKPGPEMGIFEHSNTICGQETGFFLLIVQSGSQPFRYDFIKNGDVLNEDYPMNGNAQPFSNLGVGTYDVTVYDDLGCASTKEVIIDIRPLDFGFAETVQDATCGEDNGLLSIDDAPAGYTFEWMDADSNIISDQASAQDLGAGRYFVRITAPDGCYQAKNYTIQSLGGPELEITETFDVACANEGTGAVQFIINGTGNFTATVPTTNITQQVSGGDTITLDGLSAGWYTLLINDDNNCSSVRNFTILEDPIQTVETLNAPSDCKESNGSICLTIYGGRAPYTVTGDAGTYFNILAGNNVCLPDLESGIYNLMVTDQAGCEMELQYNLMAPNQPSIDLAELQIRDIICPEDNTTGFIGSTNGVTYNVYNANNQLVGATPLNNLGAGNYIIKYEENGCEAEAPIQIDAPADWDVQIIENAETCDGYDGSIQLLVNGANGGFNFDWADGITNTGSVASELTSLESYSVTITDQFGCRYSLDTLNIEWDCDECDDKFSLERYNGEYEDGDFVVCLPLVDLDLQDLDILLNGQIYTGPIDDCSSVQVFYEFNSLLNLGQPPFLIKEWDYGTGVLENKRFDDLNELVGEMNTFDPLGNWRVDEIDNKILGGTNNSSYGKFVIEHLDSRTTLQLAINEQMVDRQSITVPGEGNYMLIVQDNAGRCADTLQMNLKFKAPVIEEPDSVHLQTTLETPLYNICLPTSLTGNLTMTFCETPSFGIVDLIDEPCLNYNPNPGFLGTDKFCIDICDDEGNCQQIIITVDVSERKLIIYTAISPNEDGVNDYLYIENIEFFPDNTVIIFNRWGNKVYEKTGYTNDLPWHGTFNNDALPDGTYYYIIEDGEGEVFKGYLQINR
ncbi:MAG: gliding motility-associated C-terminal domain-containing protein [Saprospiraceae bacterium]